jgi:hypothetical protein
MAEIMGLNIADYDTSAAPPVTTAPAKPEWEARRPVEAEMARWFHG